MSLTCERLGNRGSVGVLSIIVMLVLSLLGAAFIAITATEVNTSANYRDGVAAQYLAEAGANRGIAELMANPDWIGNADQYNLGRGFYRVQAAAAGNNRTITATGVVGNATRSVVVRVTLGTSATNVYAYPLFSSGNLNIDNNAQANGSVRSNATINVNNNARVSQDVIAHGSVNIGNNAVIGGKETEGAAVLTVPAYERSDYSGGQPIDNVGNNGRLTLGGGSYYRSGDLVFGNNAVISGEGIIYVAGNVIFENNVSFTGRVFIIAEGDINVGNGVTIHNGVLHSPRNFNLGNNSNIAGSAVAGGVINVHNNAVITYNQSVVQHFGLGGTTTLNINSWGNQ